MFRKLFGSLFVTIMVSVLVMLNTQVCFAAVAVNDENLNQAFQKFITSNCNDQNYKISVENKKIVVSSDEGNYILNYDLTNNPTFSYEIEIKKGMSYKEFQEKTENSSYPMLGYLAVANIQGVEFEDCAAYFSLALLQAFFSGIGSANVNNSYIIVSDGVDVENSGDRKVIKESEFGEHVMEYMNDLYKEKTSITDSEAFNTFEWATEKKEVTETSCKLVSTITVNLNADFSKLKGFAERASETALDKNITEQNADYTIKLKVGQKCKIESTERITGYELYGNNCVEFNKEYTEITAIKEGKANGYLYVGVDKTKKSIYIIVEENKENQNLEISTLKINSNTPNNSTNQNVVINDQKSNTQKVEVTNQDKTVANQKIPQTGNRESNLLISMIAICAVFAILFGIKNRKYKI